MPRKLYVPIWNTNIDESNREEYVSDLKNLGASTVFFSMSRECLFDRDYNGEMQHLRRNIRYFKKKGFETGAWIQGFGFGAPIEDKYAESALRYTKITAVNGARASGDAFCPLNSEFQKDYADLLKSIAETFPDLIMIDDDMCMSVRPGLGCFCSSHISLIEDETGESLSGRDLPKLLFTGGKNKYRSAWLRVMDKTHTDFCRMAREAVDSVSPNIRLGFASGYTSWDIEGADAIKLSHILAGGTKPFLRLTGAPYWMAKSVNRFDGQQLSSAIEIARIQEAWCHDSGIEIFSEADSYPRPRYHVPSSLIECFDLGTAASGGMGCLKYVYDYHLPFDHERGYSRHHIYNRPLYDAIEKYFDGKETIGVRVYESMRKIESSELPSEFVGQEAIMRGFFSPAASLLGVLSIPARHEGESDCGIAFGENVRELDSMPRRMIIDLSAAEIMIKKGIDIGAESILPAPVPKFEYHDCEKAAIYKRHGRFGRFLLKSGARVVTEFSASCERFPASYRYDNGETEFFVLTFDGYSVRQNSMLFLSYIRQKTLLEFVGRLPHIANNPCVWTIAKRGGDETVILCLNIFEDPLIDASLELGRAYSSVKMIGATGELDGERVWLTTPIPPYGAFIAVLRD